MSEDIFWQVTANFGMAITDVGPAVRIEPSAELLDKWEAEANELGISLDDYIKKLFEDSEENSDA
jgi:hypothetical protein